MANRYSKALRHLKNKNIDEKLELLEQLPTNNTTGLYVDVPGVEEPAETVPGDLPLDQGLDLTEDGDGAEGYTGNDTTGLFLADGTIKSVEPPGDTSYILGPMISMWYAWANYTQIGYVRQADRKMVNLGRITGEMSDWDGETGFTGYGQMSIEQAVWYKGQTRADYRAFYPGPPSNPADQYGRYIGSMISSSKSTTRIIPGYWDPGTNRSGNASDNFAAQVARGEVPIPQIPRGNAQYDAASELVMIGISAALAKALMGGLVALGARARREVAEFVKLWKSTGRGTGPLSKSTTPRTTKATYKSDPLDKLLRNIDQASKASPPKGSSFTRGDNIRGPYSAEKSFGSGKYKSSSRNYDSKNNPSFGSRRGTRKFNNSYDPHGTSIAAGVEELPVELIAIDNSILAEIGNKPESINKLISILEKSPKKITPVKESKEFLSENRKRILRDIKKPVQVKEMPTKFKVKPTGRKNKSVGVDMMKIPDTPKQYKPPMNVWGKADYNANVRASQEKKNEVLELLGAAEHHWTYLTEDKRKQKQEKVNEELSAEFDKQLELLYEKHKMKENKTSKVISYLKDSNLVYDKLDPQSAEAMPPTGDPTIDANVKKATNAKEKARKLKILFGKKA